MFKRVLAVSSLFLLILASAALGAEPSDGSNVKFLFGVETHLARIFDWTDTNRGIPGKTREESYKIMLQYIDDLGVSMVRDGSHFDNLMPQMNGSLQFGTMEKILPDLNARGIVLDWVIVSTPSWAADGSFGTGSTYNRPPLETAWNSFLTALATRSKAYGGGIIFELWNEPNLNVFWSGTSAQYIELLGSGASAIKSISAQNRVANGGMVTDTSDSAYYTSYKTMLDGGEIDFLTIHSHGEIDTLRDNFAKNVAPHRIDNKRIILNESGYPLRDDSAQALHTAGKAIWAIGNGLGGYSAFYLGCIGREANADLAEGNPSGRDYSLISDQLEPRPSYTAYKTVISMLDGATAERKMHEGNGRYEYLFTKNNRKIYAAIGGRSDAAEVASSLGTSRYKTYDMMGREDGPERNILYFIPEASAEIPSIDRHPQSQSVQAGETAEFSVLATGAGPLSHQWQKYSAGTWDDIIGARDSFFRLPNAQISDNGNRYRVVVSNDAGSTVSQEALLTVKEAGTGGETSGGTGGGGCNLAGLGVLGFCLAAVALKGKNLRR